MVSLVRPIKLCRVARFLGVTTSLVNRYASSEKLTAMDQ